MAEPSNVTPFRPRKPAPPPKKPGLDLQRPQHKVVLVYALTAGAFLFYWLTVPPISYMGLALGVAAVAIAASNREEGMPWARTHHEFALRTVLIGGAVWVLAALVMWIPVVSTVAFFVQLAALAWVGVRVVAGLIRAAQRKPTPNPRTLLL